MIRVNGFVGVDKKNENVSGTIPFALNADFGDPIGRISKRKGMYKLFDVAGQGGIRGLFAHHSERGNEILFAHDKKMYSLSDGDRNIVADFTKGEHIGTNDEVGALSNINTELMIEYAAGSDRVITIFGQIFKMERSYLSAFSVMADYTTYVSFDIDVMDEERNLLHTQKISSVYVENGQWLKIELSSPVMVPTDHAFVLIRPTNLFRVRHVEDEHFSKDDIYDDGGFYNGYDFRGRSRLTFRAYTVDFEQEWTSPSFDLGMVPIESKIVYDDYIPEDAEMKLLTRGSTDNIVWGEWQETTEALPLTRYIQIRVEASVDDYKDKWYLYELKIQHLIDTYVMIADDIKDNRICFDEWDDMCFFCDGDKTYVYDGESVSETGIGPPALAPTATDYGSGTFSGKYSYKVTFVNSKGQESNPSVASNEISISNKESIKLSDIPTKTGYNRRIYRTKDNISVYYLVEEINDTDTTYYDSKNDDLLVLEMSDDNDLPLPASLICFHKNYLFYVPTSDSTKLYYCKVMNPNASPSNFYKQLPGKIRSVKSYADQLIVSGETFTVAFSGSIFHSTIDETTQRVISNVGALSHEGVVQCVMYNVGVVLVMPTKEGYKYLTPGLSEFSLLQRHFSYEVGDYVEQCIRSGRAGHISATEFESVLYISLTYYDEGQLPVGHNNCILPYNLITGKWYGLWSMSTSGLVKSDGALLCGSPTEGALYELLRGSDDAGDDIKFISDIPVNTEDRLKFRRMKVVVSKESVTDTMVVEHQIDTSSKTTQTIPGPRSEWNENISGHHGMVTMKSRVMYPKLKTGHYYIARIKDESKNPFSIYGIEVEEG